MACEEVAAFGSNTYWPISENMLNQKHAYKWNKKGQLNIYTHAHLSSFFLCVVAAAALDEAAGVNDGSSFTFNPVGTIQYYNKS